MKINTIQTILFRQLRELHEQHKSGAPPEISSGNSKSRIATSHRERRPVLLSAISRLFSKVNAGLASFLKLSERTGLDLPAMESQTSRHIATPSDAQVTSRKRAKFSPARRHQAGNCERPFAFDTEAA